MPRNFLGDTVDCEHVWIEKTTPTNKDGGYMILKFCHLCMATEGYGFINKDHELNYLNKLLDADDDMLK